MYPRLPVEQDPPPLPHKAKSSSLPSQEGKPTPLTRQKSRSAPREGIHKEDPLPLEPAVSNVTARAGQSTDPPPVFTFGSTPEPHPDVPVRNLRVHIGSDNRGHNYEKLIKTRDNGEERGPRRPTVLPVTANTPLYSNISPRAPETQRPVEGKPVHAVPPLTSGGKKTRRDKDSVIIVERVVPMWPVDGAAFADYRTRVSPTLQSESGSAAGYPKENLQQIPQNPQIPHSSMSPQSPHGSMSPQSPHSSLSPQCTHGPMSPQSSHGPMSPQSPGGPMSPQSPISEAWRKQLRDMTVQTLREKLLQLGLGEKANRFNYVDGDMLTDISDDMLGKEPFLLGEFEVLQVKKFRDQGKLPNTGT